MTGKPLGLYFHCPFCQQKCPYCHFYVLKNDKAAHSRLVDAYLIELERYVLPHLQGFYIDTVYFGGGTPALLDAEQLGRILDFLEEHIPSFRREDAEVTLEVNPGEASLDRFKRFASVGIQRISLGVQSFDDLLLKELGRKHSSAQALQAIEDVRRAGISNLTIDLMYDTPKQSLESWKHSLSLAVQQPITHLSLYNLTLEPRTAFHRKRETLIPLLPSEETSKAMLELAIETLTHAGFEHYELSAFAKPGYSSKHNKKYWTGSPFFGVGPSAFSDWEGSRFQNIANLKDYEARLARGDSPREFTETLDPEARQRELFTLALRLQEGVEGGSHEPEAVPHLIKEGFLSREGSRLKLTHKGRLFYDTVAVELI